MEFVYKGDKTDITLFYFTCQQACEMEQSYLSPCEYIFQLSYWYYRHLLFVYISYYMHWSQHNFFMRMLQSCICILQEMAFRVQICFVFILFRRLISFIKIIIVDFRLKTKSFIVCFTWSFQNRNRKLEGALDNFSLIPDFFFFFKKSWDFHTIRSACLCNESMLNLAWTSTYLQEYLNFSCSGHF